MFDDIEREYKKDLQVKRFVAYYRPRALVIVLVALALSFVIGVNHWLIYAGAAVIFAGTAIVFFIKEYRHAHRTLEAVRQGRNLATRMSAYQRTDDTRRIDKLVTNLAHHNLRTKSDIELALNYFQSRLPVNRKPNLLEWIFTAVVALSSIVIVTYDNSINTINTHRLFTILAPTMIVALIILTPLIIARLVSAGISASRSHIDTSLVQDLAYICVNFDKFRAKLEEKSAKIELESNQLRTKSAPSSTKPTRQS